MHLIVEFKKSLPGLSCAYIEWEILLSQINYHLKKKKKDLFFFFPSWELSGFMHVSTHVCQNWCEWQNLPNFVSFHVSEQALAADTLIFQYIVKNGKISMQLFYFVLEM